MRILAKLAISAFFILIGSNALAEPTLTPSSGEITENQTFIYSANGIAVQDFWIYVGTSAASNRNIADSGSLGSADSSYSATNLPTGPIYFTLWYKASNTWQHQVFEFSLPASSTSEPLASELGCTTGELIRATPTDWECVESDSLAGPDYADELCRLFRQEGAVPPSSLLCPSDNDRYVFVTKGTVRGDFGGLKIADAVCQTEADSANLSGVYRAFLSDEFTPVSSRLRLLEGVTYKTTSNSVVATSLGQLLGETLLSNPINRHANGQAAASTPLVWTNRDGDSPACAAWTKQYDNEAQSWLYARVGTPSSKYPW